MTEPTIKTAPTMDEVKTFMRSNPDTSWEMLVEILSIGDEDRAIVSGGKLRELWRLAGGAVDKRGRAWIEIDLLPSVLRKIIDFALFYVLLTRG